MEKGIIAAAAAGKSLYYFSNEQLYGAKGYLLRKLKCSNQFILMAMYPYSGTLSDCIKAFKNICLEVKKRTICPDCIYYTGRNPCRNPKGYILDWYGKQCFRDKKQYMDSIRDFQGKRLKEEFENAKKTVCRSILL